jgi:hypothetical protein
MAITASHSIPSDAISIHSRMLCTCCDCDLGEEPRVSRFVSGSARSEIKGSLDSASFQKQDKSKVLMNAVRVNVKYYFTSPISRLLKT